MDNPKESKPKSFSPLSSQDLDFQKVDDLMLVHGRYEELSEKQKYEMLLFEQQYSKFQQLPSDPMHPIYYHVFSNTLPADDLYRIVPEGKSLIFIIYKSR